MVTPAGGPIVTPAGGPIVTLAGGPLVTLAGGPIVTLAGGPIVTLAGGPIVTPAGGAATLAVTEAKSPAEAKYSILSIFICLSLCIGPQGPDLLHLLCYYWKKISRAPPPTLGLELVKPASP